MAKRKAYESCFECEFGTPAIGKKGYRIPAEVARRLKDCDEPQLDVDRADEIFTGNQLDLRLEYDPIGQDEAQGQKKILDTTCDLAFIGTCAGFTARADVIRVTLGVPHDVDIHALEKFLGRTGKLAVSVLGPANPEEAAEENGEAE